MLSLVYTVYSGPKAIRVTVASAFLNVEPPAEIVGFVATTSQT